MINIIIFSLFMCILNTNAAEAEVWAIPDWLQVDATKRYCFALQSNLAQYDVAVKKSVMLQVCHELSEQLQNVSSNTRLFLFLLKRDIGIILYTLYTESLKHPDRLAQTFCDEDAKVGAGDAIRDAFGRCVPPFQRGDITAILKSVPRMPGRSKTVNGMKRRYENKEGSERFSPLLTRLLCKQGKIAKLNPDSQYPESALPRQSDVISTESASQDSQSDASVVSSSSGEQSDVISTESASQDSQPDASVVSSSSGEEDLCFTRKSVQENYEILQSNLAKRFVTVENSFMLRVFCSLLESDYRWFEGTFVHAATPEQAVILEQSDTLVKIDIDAILHTLSQESSSDATQLDQIFRAEDAKVCKDDMMIFDALDRCVPKVDLDDIDEIVSFFPQVREQFDAVCDIRGRYERADSQRFSSALEHLCWKKYNVLKPHSEICNIPDEDCAFVQQFAYHFQQLSLHPMHCDFVYPDPYMQNMQSYVMDPACACQSLQQCQYSNSQHSQPDASVVPSASSQDSHPETYDSSSMHDDCELFDSSRPNVVMDPELASQCPVVVMDPSCAYQYSQQFQYSNPMNGVYVPYCFSPIQSAVMDPEVASQSQAVALDPKHLLAYVWRGMTPNLDLGEPDYVAYAYARKKVDIEEELPKMLDRIVCMVKKRRRNTRVACLENCLVRLDQIKWFINNGPISDPQKAMLFAWAFAMERQGNAAFSILGFFRIHQKIHYLWISCRLQIANWLYALTECTNIQAYGKPMRSANTYLKHQVAQQNSSTAIPEEGESSYNQRWRSVMSVNKFYGKKKYIGYLFDHIFPEGDHPNAR
ncbi:MAG: hypothetical protein OXC30_05280 [Alphaproteobacteria bacterium]|nr:hypothetical protein [Alphaproteobacteria bacterium]